MTTPIDPNETYTPTDVSKILRVSYDTAIRRMAQMKGCWDFGVKRKRYARTRRLLRIRGADLQAYMRNRVIES